MTVGNQTTAFEAVPLEPGISDFSRDFQPDLNMDSSTVNMTHGPYEGVGPRYGIAPIKGHMKPRDVGSPLVLSSLRELEDTDNRSRLICAGITTFSWNNEQYYAWLIGDSTYFGLSVSSDNRNGGSYIEKPSIEYPLLWKSYINYTGFTVSSYALSARFASLTVSKGQEASPYIVGYTPTAGDQVNSYLNSYGLYSTNKTFFTGENPLFYGAQTRYSVALRKTNHYSFGFDALSRVSLYKARTYNSFTGNGSNGRVYKEYYNASTAGTTGGLMEFSGVNPDSTTTYAAVTNANYIMVEDYALTMGLTYSVIATAYAGIPTLFLLSQETRGSDGEAPWEVLNVNPMNPKEPKNRKTINEIATFPGDFLPYSEQGIEKTTCWAYWPTFSTASAQKYPPAYSKDRAYRTNSHVTYLPANTGVLRSGRVYEFAYSLYNKLLGTESNVGTPAKLKLPTSDGTGNLDYMAITLYRKESSNACAFDAEVLNIFGGFYGDGDYPHPFPVNWLKYRVYYRELGTFEWLPAAEVDAAQLLFDPKLNDIIACQTPLALTLGGQPGGFNDYSGLPNTTWLDVLEYKGRLFWFSEQQLVFSVRDNPFAYPARNSTTIPSGGFRGGIVHAFPGQSTQDSRLVVFTDQDMYVGVFRGPGYGVTANIPISATTTAEFEYEGSDFYLELRSSYSAFSSRSAVVADGILYFWGPAGIFEDGGVDIPARISQDVDRLLPQLYDSSKTERIHAVYMPETKEIVWFYPPASGTSVTKAIVYNRRTSEFYFYDFGSTRIDWSANVNLVKTTIDGKFAGKRVIIGATGTENGVIHPQRPAFFDARIHEGDMPAEKEVICMQTAFPVPDDDPQVGVIVVDGPTSSMNVGDIFTFKDVSSYTNAVSIADCKAVVTKKVNSQEFWVKYPAGVTRPDVWTNNVSSRVDVFPVFASKVNGMAYKLQTKYWMPAGPRFWGWWKYAHMIFKTTYPAQTAVDTVTFSHKPIQDDAVEASYTLSLNDNCDGHTQVMRAFSAENQASLGQGLRFVWSGLHTGGEWYLQYLRCEVIPQSPQALNAFEG